MSTLACSYPCTVFQYPIQQILLPNVYYAVNTEACLTSELAQFSLSQIFFIFAHKKQTDSDALLPSVFFCCLPSGNSPTFWKRSRQTFLHAFWNPAIIIQSAVYFYVDTGNQRTHNKQYVYFIQTTSPRASIRRDCSSPLTIV